MLKLSGCFFLFTFRFATCSVFSETILALTWRCKDHHIVTCNCDLLSMNHVGLLIFMNTSQHGFEFQLLKYLNILPCSSILKIIVTHMWQYLQSCIHAPEISNRSLIYIHVQSLMQIFLHSCTLSNLYFSLISIYAMVLSWDVLLYRKPFRPYKDTLGYWNFVLLSIQVACVFPLGPKSQNCDGPDVQTLPQVSDIWSHFFRCFYQKCNDANSS